ncbi:MAG TPA: metal-dependent hydrolase [Pyrinomonadaceae bacterium]|jgi:membrane-bound metal-dependent hydrolase YbcI (DUF457 family)
MFIGHFAVGFAAKKLAPKTNLSWLIAAPLFLDLIWSFFVLGGLEKVKIEPGNTAFTPLNFVHYPFTHSLVAAIGWSLLLGLVYYAVSRYRIGAIVIGIGVLSHWVLDAAVHRPDLPLLPGNETKIGLGLWNSVSGTIIVESLLFIIGVGIYRKVTRPKNKIGQFGFWGFVIFLVLIYISNILSSPPPDVTTLAFVALLVWVFPLLAGWIDSHREVLKSPQ